MEDLEAAIDTCWAICFEKLVEFEEKREAGEEVSDKINNLNLIYPHLLYSYKTLKRRNNG